MKCPRCGTDNVQNRATCYLCQTPLQSTPAVGSPVMGGSPSGGYVAQGRPHGGSQESLGSLSQGGQVANNPMRSGTQGFHAQGASAGASMDSGFGTGLGQVMKYPPQEREVGNPNSADSWMSPPVGVPETPQATEQIPVPAFSHGASQDTAPYTTPDFAQALHEANRTTPSTQGVDALGSQHDLAAQSGAQAGYTSGSYSNDEAAATEEIQAGRIPAMIEASQDQTSPSQPAIQAHAHAAPSTSTGSADSVGSVGSVAPDGRRRLPKPRIERDFVFAPKVALPSLFRRLIAGGIDMTIVIAIAGLVTLLFGPKLSHPFPHNLHGIDLLATMLQRYTPQFNFLVAAFAITLFLYSAILLSLRGQTVGKMLMRLKVIDRSGKPFSITGALARSLAMLLSVFAGLIGLTWILFDKEYRGLHDRLSGALVIHTPPAS